MSDGSHAWSDSSDQSLDKRCAAMDNLPRPGHVSKDRFVSIGAANVRDQTPAVGSDLAAPSQAVCTYDELLDARYEACRA